MEKISKLSKDGCDDALLDYIYENYDEIECELNGEEYKEPKKHNRNFCVDCNLEMIPKINFTLSLKRKCVYKRLDNFKTILNQFFYGGKQFVPDDVMDAIRNEIRDETNILYNYTIHLTIPILECILKRSKMMKYKNSIYCILFNLSNRPFPHITTKEYGMVLNVFNIVSSIHDKYIPKGRKNFLNYPFVLKQILIVLGKVEYIKYITPLKTHSEQKELERIWNQITNDSEWVVALQRQKIVQLTLLNISIFNFIYIH